MDVWQTNLAGSDFERQIGAADGGGANCPTTYPLFQFIGGQDIGGGVSPAGT
ncbi:hypothetical protein Poly59_17990 [Rubripirellula reticaptiva]|uniref:Uncharacterized protein n=1 Tax=Rubripirellula reticaptiva TaxID=2528013 RepID=A0A5C6F4Q7_9BACT|nr:hypothetical protein Poly59_17990 [Rubripirellula reticaptiva]